ncbi:MAG TPA: glycosyltransferase family 39 protein [Candidatus Acidoferrum sp.]|nr:glycosyltransferase family 39 protein [Candidatus Acidoferrum sp.]
MNIRPVSELALYRYRWGISYFLLAALTALLLVLNYANLPAGMSTGEQASTLASNRLAFTLNTSNIVDSLRSVVKTTDVVNLPYHLLQKASLHFFGLSALGVRLPSMAIAGLTAVLFFVLLHRLLRPSTAVVMGVLVVTSSWFVGLGRLGTADCMIVFWTVTILLLATLVSQRTTLAHIWKVLLLLSIGLALYTPYMAFLLLAAAIASIAQPHLRYMVRYTDTSGATLSIIFFAIIWLPLGASIWFDPGTILRLVNISPAIPGPGEFVSNILISLNMLLNPLAVSFNGFPQPLVPLPIAVLGCIGIVCLARDWHSVRSHVFLVWLAVLVPLIGLDTTHNLVTLFVPLMLVAAIGLQALIRYWYVLFPRNPYARVFGLLPLSLLVITLVQFNYQRYFLAMPYVKATAALYNQDPFILTDLLATKLYQSQRLVLVVPSDSTELYSIDTVLAPYLTVVSNGDFTATNNATSVIVAIDSVTSLTAAQQALLPANKQPRLIVNDRSDDSLRFLVYSSL